MRPGICLAPGAAMPAILSVGWNAALGEHGAPSAHLSASGDPRARISEAWTPFKAAYVTDDGRVIDSANGGISHSGARDTARLRPFLGLWNSSEDVGPFVIDLGSDGAVETVDGDGFKAVVPPRFTFSLCSSRSKGIRNV